MFAADEQVFTWADVVRLARLRGVWADLVEQAGLGEAALGALEARGTPIGDDEVDEAGRAFRYRHDLLASEELVGWLERRGLTVEDWHGFLRRGLAVCRSPSVHATAGAADLETEAWVEGICSGRLARLALELADRVAVAPDAPIDLLDDAFDTFCRQVAEAAPVAAGSRRTARVGTNRLRDDYARQRRCRARGAPLRARRR